MKKKIKIFVLLIVLMCFTNIGVKAATANLSVSSSNVNVGDTFTVTVNASSVASWNINMSATGPVSNCSIIQSNSQKEEVDSNKSFSTTCTATAEGAINLVLSGDVSGVNDDNSISISDSKSVMVSQKTTVTPEITSSKTDDKVENKTKTDTEKKDESKSENNNLKELLVEGYTLTKVSNNKYTLSVPNDVTSINIKATLEDVKAKVTGIGNHSLKVGDNSFEIIITAESGKLNKIDLKVTRKDGYAISDLESVLKNNKLKDISINIKADTIISSKNMEMIKNSKKTVRLNYYNSDKKLVYSWIIDGSKLSNSNELSTKITKKSDNKKNIVRLSNHKDGIFVNLKQSKLPKGIKLKFYVGDKYKGKVKLNVYRYIKSKDSLKLIGSKESDKDGYVEFDVASSNEYFITPSTLSKPHNVVVEENDGFNVIKPLIFVIGIVFVCTIVALIVYLKKKKIMSSDLLNNKNI